MSYGCRDRAVLVAVGAFIVAGIVAVGCVVAAVNEGILDILILELEIEK